MIIFDLDDTLIDTTGSITPIQLEKALYKMVEAGLQVGNFEEAAATLKRMDVCSESASQTLKEFLELVDGDPPLLSIGLEVVYGALPDDLVVFPLEHAAQVLEELREDHQLALASIGNPAKQLLKMKNAGLDSTIFSKIVISEKEDKKVFYQKILDELSKSPVETIVCGDRSRRDLVPAKQLGCRTIQMQWGRGLSSSYPSSAVDYQIRRLSQIREIIENL